jgi:hypothetical protein
MHVTVERSTDPVDLSAFADAYAGVVKRIAMRDREERQHVG